VHRGRNAESAMSHGVLLGIMVAALVVLLIAAAT
jgi:tetrahydromethanopterin S-methyltransferase subunit B